MSQVDVAVLRALRAAGENGVSDRFLAAEASVDSVVIGERIAALRDAGYDISETENLACSARDYCLVSGPDRLIADDLRAALGDCTIGDDIIVVEETRSTNDFVFQTLRGKFSEGLVVFAERQTQGRGQRSNRWESAARKGLWFSVLLRPKIALAESVRLTNWAAEAIASTIRDQLEIVPEIKPPNDVYVGGRKVAGVLVEMRAEPEAGYAAIAGLGININHAAEDFSEDLRGQAVSLAMIAGRKIDRYKFAVALLQELDRSYGAQFSRRNSV
jgi:BirA family biotin operon repressor/biotin-[acetyl-CoA-carboxylase] ligase